MPEVLDDINYQVDSGDPTPKAQAALSPEHRSKLDSIVQTMVKNKESDKVIQAVVNDFKSKYSAIPTPAQQPKQEQPAFQIQLTQPTLRAIPATTVTQPSAPNKEINIPKEQVAYVPDEKTYEIQKQAGKARVAHEKVNTALVGNDAQYEKKLRESRRDNYTIESLRNEYKQKGQILAPQEEQGLLQKEKDRQFNLPVTAEDITDFKTGTIINPKLSRKFVKDLNDKDVSESAYQVDKFNELANDPDPYAHKRIEKINENAREIKKGKYVYDPETKTLIQPLGLVGSLIEGTKNKFKSDEEHDFLKNTKNDAAIINQLEDERNNPNVDEPIKVPRGKTSEFLMSAAEMPITPILAGVAGTVGGTFIGNPELGTVAATALGAYENRKAQYRSTFKQVYNELRDQGKPEFTALSEARKQAENAQEIGTIIGGAQGLIGAKLGAIPIKGTNFNVGFQQAIGDFLKKNGSEFGKIALDAVAQGGLAASGEVAKNKIAQAAGIKRDIDSGTADAFWGNVFMSGAIGAALKLGRGMSSVNYKKILNGLVKNVPEETINTTLQEKVASGEITQQAADQALSEINKYKEKDAQIPPNVTEEARFKIQDNIDKLNELEQQKETTHKSLQEPIKEKIQKLTEQNLELSKETEKPIKSETGLPKAKEKEANDFAHELVDEGVLPDTYWEAVKKDPIKFWQTVAQQAQNRDENWKPLSQSIEEQSVRDNYGDTVVDYAKELFPAPEIKESSISVIQPGEIKHPETITIKPREEAKTVKPTFDEAKEGDKVSWNIYGNESDKEWTVGKKVTMRNGEPGIELIRHVSAEESGALAKTTVHIVSIEEFNNNVKSKENAISIGAGKEPTEQIGHVEISEHGEDTKTAAGKENGIGPSPLTKEGQEEAHKLGQYIAENNKTKIITSEVERGLQTAEEAAKEAKRITGKDVPIERNELLNTANIGSDEGKPEGTFKEKEWFEGEYRPDGSESPESFKDRMEKAYEYVKSLPEETHVVSHSKVMRALDALSKTDGKWTDETTNIFLNNKELTHAIQEPSAGSVLQHPQEGIGAEGGERGGMEPGKQGEETTGTRSQEEDKAKGQEKVKPELTVDEAYGLPFIEEPGDKRTGIKNIISKSTRFERRLPPVEVGKLGTDQEILLEGKSLVDNNVINPVDVVNRILDTKEGMQPDEAKAMQYYMHQLGQQDTNLRERLAGASTESERAEINGQLQQLSDEIDAATQANIISGKAWSDVGNIRQIVSDTGFNASRDLATIKEAYGGKIPKDVQAALDKALKERDDALNKLAKLQADEKNKAAEDTIKKEGAPRNTKKTKEQFKNERNEIKQSISDKLKQARSGESGLTTVPLPFAKELISISPEIFKLIKSYAEEGVQKTEEVINRLHDVLKDEIEGIQKADIVNLLAGRYKAEGENVSKVSQRIRDYRTEANLWTKIADATKMEEDTPAKRQEKNKKLEDLRDRLNEIRKRNNEAITQAKDILTTDVQKELKKLTRQRRALETRYKTKKYLVPTEKTGSPISAEIIKEKQRIVNANYKIRIEKRKAFESKKNMYQKALMWIGRGVRLSVLSGYNVLGKLASAATIGGAGRRLPEQAIGFIYGNAFKGISERAPIEGFVNASAEAKFYKEFFNPKTFVKNSWEILKSGESPLSKKFSPGTYEHIPGIYLPTDLHQIIKDPLKRATYEASLKNALVWAERNGMDINDDLVIQSLETAAYKRAQYEIFQEQNWLSKKFGEWKHNMEESGNLGATGKFLADFMIPVSTVPTNIARRLVTTSPFGLIRGSIKVIEAYRKGVESLTPEQADSVMRQLKQGTLGTALWLIGWYGYAQFGGLYSKFNPNKERDQGDLMSDEMSVGGQMVPKPVQHALPLEIIQFAATARRVYDNYSEHKGASTPESIEKAGLASIGALTEQIPVVETIAHTIGAFTNPYEAKKLEEDVKRRFEPQILRETGIIGKDKEGGNSGGAGATGTVSREKPTRIKPTRVNPHKR